MIIPKILYQTYKSFRSIPRVTQAAMLLQRIYALGWKYEFYDDERIEDFIKAEFGGEVFSAYDRLAIGASKADFFRYAVLYKKGGVYLDVDSEISGSLDTLVRATDRAIIAREGNPSWYVQWALVYAPGHPFMARTLENVLANITSNRYPYDVHQMTGPAVYTQSIKQCLDADPRVPYRQVEVDYGRFFRYKRRHSKVLYINEPYWREAQKKGVLKPRLEDGSLSTRDSAES